MIPELLVKICRGLTLYLLNIQSQGDASEATEALVGKELLL